MFKLLPFLFFFGNEDICLINQSCSVTGYDKRKSVTSVSDTNTSKEFGIEMLLDNHDHGSKIMMFETLNIHDRKLWLQNMNDAIGKYCENVELEKKKKYSGKQGALYVHAICFS